jgi:hypothetical protein
MEPYLLLPRIFDSPSTIPEQSGYDEAAMERASKTVVLGLVGALIGGGGYYLYTNTEADGQSSTTQPSRRGYHSGFWHRPFFGGSSSGFSSGHSDSGGTSSHGTVSRGGFGGSSHAAGG